MVGREKYGVALLQKTVQELNEKMLKPRIANPIHSQNNIHESHGIGLGHG